MQNIKIGTAIALLAISGCASAILDGEHARTGPVLTPLPPTSNVEMVMKGEPPPKSYREAGQVTSRAYVLDKAFEECRRQARALRANAVVEVSYERRFSTDYLQDIYFVKGTAATIN